MFFFVTMPFWLGLILFAVLAPLNARSERKRQQQERERQQRRDDRLIAAINSLNPRKAAPSTPAADDGPRGHWLGEPASETPSSRIDSDKNTFALAAVVLLIGLAMIAKAAGVV